MSCTSLFLTTTVMMFALLWAAEPTHGAEPRKLWVYIGTYTNGGSKGIYRSELDLSNGSLSKPMLVGEAKNPSFLALHPNGRFLYAVGEVDDFDGKKSGGVSAFAIDPKSGNLSLLNQQPSGGSAPCHVVVDRQGKNVLVANYGGGSACALPIQDDGKLGKASAFVQHRGKSVNPQRQEGPHAHSINLDADNCFAFVADLGLDQVLIYQFDPAKGGLIPNDPSFVALDPGAGPRHFAFHPDGKHAYVISELNSTISSLGYDPQRGELKVIQTITTLPKGYTGPNSTAEVAVHPTGKFVYGSNRGHDSIAVFAVDSKTGVLTPAGHQGDGIKVPRNFVIDPTGTYLLVGNQDGNSVVVFRINPQTGALTATGHRVEVPRPVCIRFMPTP